MSKQDYNQHPLGMQPYFRRTLSLDLILSIILVVVGVSAAVVSLTYAYLSRKAKVQSADALAEFSDYLHDSLALPIWNIDEAGINKICHSFFENKMVATLKVTDHEGTVLFENHRNDHLQAVGQQTAITHDETVVGYFEIALNPQVFLEKQRQLMWLSLITLVSVIMVLVITLRVVLNLFLISPLNQLIQRTDQISRGDYDFVDFQAPQLEIRTIASRFNTLARRIQRREGTLQEVNQRLEKEIVEHRKAEPALLSSQQELDSIIRSTPDVIYRLDTMG